MYVCLSLSVSVCLSVSQISPLVILLSCLTSIVPCMHTESAQLRTQVIGDLASDMGMAYLTESNNELRDKVDFDWSFGAMPARLIV